MVNHLYQINKYANKANIPRTKETGAANYAPYISIPLFIIGLIFVWRSFYHMRIPEV